MGNSEGRQHYWDSDARTSDPRFPHPRLRDYNSVVLQDHHPRSLHGKSEARMKLHCPYNLVVTSGFCYLMGIGMGLVLGGLIFTARFNKLSAYAPARVKLKKFAKRSMGRTSTRMGKWGLHFFVWDCIWSLIRGREDSLNIVLGAASSPLTLRRNRRRKYGFPKPYPKSRRPMIRVIRHMIRASGFFLFFELAVMAVIGFPRMIKTTKNRSRHYITELESLKDTPWNLRNRKAHKRSKRFFQPGFITNYMRLRPAPEKILPQDMAFVHSGRLGEFADFVPQPGDPVTVPKLVDDQEILTTAYVKDDPSPEKNSYQEATRVEGYKFLGKIWQREHLHYWADVAKLEMMVRTKPNPGLEDLIPEELGQYYAENPRQIKEIQYMTMEPPSMIPWFMNTPDVPEYGYIPIIAYNPWNKKNRKAKRFMRFAKRAWGALV